jgi:hypothetical protein
MKTKECVFSLRINCKNTILTSLKWSFYNNGKSRTRLSLHSFRILKEKVSKIHQCNTILDSFCCFLTFIKFWETLVASFLKKFAESSPHWMVYSAVLLTFNIRFIATDRAWFDAVSEKKNDVDPDMSWRLAKKNFSFQTR